MCSEEQREVMQRILKNYDIILNSKTPLVNVMILKQYQSDLSTLCNEGPITAEVFNFVVELMNKIINQTRRDDKPNILQLQQYTYECCRVVSGTPKSEGSPY